MCVATKTVIPKTVIPKLFPKLCVLLVMFWVFIVFFVTRKPSNSILKTLQ